jgi:hypothetical protein
MKIRELKQYLNTLSDDLEECEVKILNIRDNKDYVDLEISTLEQSKKQILEHGLIFEIDSFDVYDIAMKVDVSTMLDIEELL